MHFIVFARVLQGADGRFTLQTRVFQTRSDLVVFEESVVLPTEREALTERADALISRFASYTPARPPMVVEGPSEHGRLYVDLSFSYLQFLERPTRELFHNLGASFGASYMLTNHFSFVGRAHFSLSGRDVKGDLLSTFNSIRGFVGVGLSFEVPAIWTRFYFQTGFEAAALSDFAATRDIRCKVYGVDDPVGECSGGEVKSYSLDTLGGLNGTLGLNIGYDPTFLVIQASSAFYFMPFNDVSVINFPLSIEVGAQYRFF